MARPSGVTFAARSIPQLLDSAEWPGCAPSERLRGDMELRDSAGADGKFSARAGRSILVSIFVNPYEQSGKDLVTSDAIHQRMLHSLPAPTHVTAPSCRAVSSSCQSTDGEVGMGERALPRERVWTEKA